MPTEWVNPKYAKLVEMYDQLPKLEGNGMNCTNCGGTGRHIFIDPNTGEMKDMGACMSCGGSGQAPQ